MLLLTGLVVKWLAHISLLGGVAGALYKVYVDFWLTNNRSNLDMELVVLKLAGAVALVLGAAVILYLMARTLLIRPLNRYLHIYLPMFREDYVDLLEIADKEEIKAYIDEVARLNPKRKITRGEFDMLQNFYDDRQIADACEQIYSGDV
ncbi:MAG: hypothetical protein MI802_27735 [Desulfobacterales bacterium]|nr:hypothetical protein [Desulfobacterales bacterium]